MNLSRLKTSCRRPVYKITAGNYTFDLGKRTYLMGILNLTSDSFSGDGVLNLPLPKIIAKAQRMVENGADIIDVGAQSTRPGALPISSAKEIKRLVPVIRALSKKNSIAVSVDTYKSETVKAALDEGAVIVNNIMGSKPDPQILKMIKSYGACIVLMHMKGNPQTMQKNPRYQDVVKDIIRIIQVSAEKCLEIGIKSDRIIIDPGIGFGKTVDQNLSILNRLEEFKILNKPLLIGTSRKSFIGKILNREVSDRLLGTAATVSTSILKGAHIIRVHDVAAMKDVVLVTDSIMDQHASLIIN